MWQADGTRYLMLIERGRVFMVGRDNMFYEVQHLFMPRDDEGAAWLTGTLIDGVRQFFYTTTSFM